MITIKLRQYFMIILVYFVIILSYVKLKLIFTSLLCDCIKLTAKFYLWKIWLGFELELRFLFILSSN